jgi:ubiquinone/menaquinone biosynthesis C-methylase UbiE
MKRSSEKVQEFYDRFGWVQEGGRTGEQKLFWAPGSGPLRTILEQNRIDRMVSAVREAGPNLNLIEAGCGGNPATALLPLCSRYTGVDFSETGLALAREKVSTANVPFDLVTGDVCSLPFPDGSFDAGYSAHVFYHIDDVAAQAKAFRELCRVVRPGGRVVLILANSRPLLFPVRLAARLAAETPVLSDALRRLRRPSPLPYLPMPLSWMRRLLSEFGTVDMTCHALESTWLLQNVSESNIFGRTVLRAMTQAERAAPHALLHLGNYVLIKVSRGH